MAETTGNDKPRKSRWKLTCLVLVIAAGIVVFDMLTPDSPRPGTRDGAPARVQTSPLAKPPALTEADFDKRIGKGVQLVDFWAAWCGPCETQAPIVAQVKADFAGRAEVYAVDIDAAPGLVKRFGITVLPTLVVFKDGKPVDSLFGVQDADALAAALEKNL